MGEGEEGWVGMGVWERVKRGGWRWGLGEGEEGRMEGWERVKRGGWGRGVGRG